MAKDATLPDFSGKFQICLVNPSSLSDNLSDNLKKKPNVELFADLYVKEIPDQVTSNRKQSL